MAHISLPSLWRARGQKYRLEGTRCPGCRAIHFPPRPICPCGSRKFEPVEMARAGTIYTYTIVTEASTASEHSAEARALGPFPIALVELDNGVRVMGQVADCDPEEVSIGMRVEMVFRRMYGEGGLVHYGYKFVPFSEDPTGPRKTDDFSGPETRKITTRPSRGGRRRSARS
ncbi:MAG: Zn-ribbon domain-containing OB-fold protein [Euryarchaeota archaeon]|nr:Zn-ribbon domain-containing OB-fold protein [Euryarchaeota archaeon]